MSVVDDDDRVHDIYQLWVVGTTVRRRRRYTIL